MKTLISFIALLFLFLAVDVGQNECKANTQSKVGTYAIDLFDFKQVIFEFTALPELNTITNLIESERFSNPGKQVQNAKNIKINRQLIATPKNKFAIPYGLRSTQN